MINLDNKNIALFGNGMSIVYKERPTIDNDHDVYIRLNEGTTKKNERWVGSKTDIVGLSMNLDKDRIHDLYGKVDHIIYCSPNNRLELNKYLQETAIFYPFQNWTLLADMLDARPSTGIMMIDFLWHYVDFAQLHLYGFDFWETPNRNTGVKHIAQHDPLCEKEYLTRLMTRDKRIFYHE